MRVLRIQLVSSLNQRADKGDWAKELAIALDLGEWCNVAYVWLFCKNEKLYCFNIIYLPNNLKIAMNCIIQCALKNLLLLILTV